MAEGFSKELVGVLDGSAVPPSKADGRVYHSRLRCIRATFDLSQSTVKRVVGDTNVIGYIPEGCRFAGERWTTDTSLGTSTVSSGNSSSAAAYKAAAVFTATDTPTWYGKASALAADPVTASTKVSFTVATADLPSSGILVIELFYTGR